MIEIAEDRGQRAMAAATYRSATLRLAEELGVEPGPELWAAQKRIDGGRDIGVEGDLLRRAEHLLVAAKARSARIEKW